MSSTPIPPGSSIVVEKADENDPESVLEVFLLKDNEDEWEQLGNSFGAEDIASFWWLVDSAAAYHSLPVQLGSGVTRP